MRGIDAVSIVVGSMVAGGFGYALGMVGWGYLFGAFVWPVAYVTFFVPPRGK